MEEKILFFFVESDLDFGRTLTRSLHPEVVAYPVLSLRVPVAMPVSGVRTCLLRISLCWLPGRTFVSLTPPPPPLVLVKPFTLYKHLISDSAPA